MQAGYETTFPQKNKVTIIVSYFLLIIHNLHSIIIYIIIGLVKNNLLIQHPNRNNL